MAKAKTPTDEKFEKIDFDLFEALSAIDRKDYGYYDRLTEEQKKKFVPFMMTYWTSVVKSDIGMQQYYLLATNEFANVHLFNENVQKHPKLQWLMLCRVGMGKKQFHQWLPQIKDRVSKLKDKAKREDIKDYYSKTYGNITDDLLNQLVDEYISSNKRKIFLAQEYPHMKISDIEVLNAIITDYDIKRYETETGN
jgi:hypothetical protein